MMRITRSTEAISPLVESIAAIGVGFALFYGPSLTRRRRAAA